MHNPIIFSLFLSGTVDIARLGRPSRRMQGPWQHGSRSPLAVQLDQRCQVLHRTAGEGPRDQRLGSGGHGLRQPRPGQAQPRKT